MEQLYSQLQNSDSNNDFYENNLNNMFIPDDGKDDSIKSENPLDDKFVKKALKEAQLTDYQLINLSVKELNRRLLTCSKKTISELKHCRRTLKNRGYAKNCRIKRIAVKKTLIETNDKLKSEVEKLKEQNRQLVEKIRSLETENQINERIITTYHFLDNIDKDVDKSSKEHHQNKELNPNVLFNSTLPTANLESQLEFLQIEYLVHDDPFDMVAVEPSWFAKLS